MATIVPCPLISRGTEATVPSPPGLVSVMLRPHEVVGGQRVRARLLDQRVVGLEEAIEGQAPGVEDHGHHQRARAVALLDVHRQPEVHLPVATRWGLPSTSAKWSAITGISSAARAIA